jgi:hypothetical protein
MTDKISVLRGDRMSPGFAYCILAICLPKKAYSLMSEAA